MSKRAKKYLRIFLVSLILVLVLPFSVYSDGYTEKINEAIPDYAKEYISLDGKNDTDISNVDSKYVISLAQKLLKRSVKDTLSVSIRLCAIVLMCSIS